MKKNLIRVATVNFIIIAFCGCETLRETQSPPPPLDGTQSEIASHSRMETNDAMITADLALLSDNGKPIQNADVFDRRGDLVANFGGVGSSIKVIWNLMTVSSGPHRLKAVIKIRSTNSKIQMLEPFEFEVEDLEPRHRYAFYLVSISDNDADLFASIRRGNAYIKMIDRTHGLDSHFNAQVWLYERGVRLLKKVGHTHESLQ